MVLHITNHTKNNSNNIILTIKREYYYNRNNIAIEKRMELSGTKIE